MYPMFSWGFYILVNMALLLGATPLLDFIVFRGRKVAIFEKLQGGKNVKVPIILFPLFL